MKAVIFDLDGVIVDTAEYHFQAWKKLADSQHIYFDKVINERLKGVSRIESLNIILEHAERPCSREKKEQLTDQKNNYYLKLLENISSENILYGIYNLLIQLKYKNIKTAIYSSSKNTNIILNKIGIRKMFDIVITGNDVTRSKPDPEGLIIAAQKLELLPEQCLLIEDSFAGIEAGLKAGMKTLGIGDRKILNNAHFVVSDTRDITMAQLEKYWDCK